MTDTPLRLFIEYLLLIPAVELPAPRAQYVYTIVTATEEKNSRKCLYQGNNNVGTTPAMNSQSRICTVPRSALVLVVT